MRGTQSELNSCQLHLERECDVYNCVSWHNSTEILPLSSFRHNSAAKFISSQTQSLLLQSLRHQC